jgi:WD40 repeat protein
MPSFFLSYSRRDQKAVEHLRDLLRTWGYESLFLDVDPDEGLEVGVDWEAELYRKLRLSDAVIFVGTSAAAASRWCFAELTLARSAQKPIFPLKFDEGVRLPLLDRQQWLRIDGDQAAFDHLRRVLTQRFPPSDAFAWDSRRSPYPGLTAFQAEDAAMFFGREVEVEVLLARLDGLLGRGRCVAVIGASGSGKSSLVRAGVLPRLARLPERWIALPTFTPGDRPLAALARSLAAGLNAAGTHADRLAIQQRIERDPGELIELVRDVAAARGGERSVLLVIDQAEELVVQASEDERERFLHVVRAGLRVDARFWVLATLRSEFLSASLRDTRLGQLIDESVLVSPLDRSRLPEVIAGPARKAGLDLEPGLLERMVEDTPGGDALPLLAYTLRELYDRRAPDRQVLCVADYDALGGVHGALRARADGVLERLADAGQGELVIPTLLRLTTVDAEGEPVRRPVALDALSPSERAVLDPFADARLLTTARRGGSATIEVAHEALLRAWPPLQNAIAASRERLRIEAELERDAQAWTAHARGGSYLLRGERLARARLLLSTPGAGGPEALEPGGREFYLASEALEQRERRTRRARRRRAIVGIAAAVLLLGLITARSVRESRRAADQRDTAQSLLLGTNALRQLPDSPDRALTLAARAFARKATPLAEGALRAAVQASVRQVILHRNGEAVENVAIASDGRHLAIGGFDDARIVDLRRPSGPSIAIDDTTEIFAFAPDAIHLAGVTSDGTIRVWDRRRPAAVTSTLRGSFRSAEAVFAPDGAELAVAAGSRVRIWRWQVGGSVTVVLRDRRLAPRELTGIAYSPDGTRLAVASHRGIIRVWDMRRPGRSPLRLRDHDPSTLTFAPDGRHLLAGSLDGRVRIFDIRRRAPGTVLFQAESGPAAIAFDPDGRHLLCAVDHAVGVWSWPSPDVPTVILRGHTRSVTALAVAPDGRAISGSDDGTVRIWTWRDAAEPSAPLGAGWVSSLAFRSDGARLAGGYENGRVAVWDWRRPSRPAVIARHKGDVIKLGFPRHAGRGAAIQDGNIRVSDARSGVHAALSRPIDPPLIAFSPDGRFVAGVDANDLSSSLRSGVRIWRLDESNHPPVAIPGPTPTAMALDAENLATADVDGTVRVWDWRRPTARPAVLHRPTEAPNLFGAEVDLLAFSPDGHLLAFTSEVDPTVGIWDWRRKGSALTIVRGLSDTARFVSLSADGQHVATVDDRGVARIWDWRALAAPAIDVPVDRGGELAFAPDGRHLAVSTGTGVRLWRCDGCGPITAVAALARARAPHEVRLR